MLVTLIEIFIVTFRNPMMTFSLSTQTPLVVWLKHLRLVQVLVSLPSPIVT